MSRFSVIYDACVLYPAPLRDFLVELATAELFQARWTEDIHEEWIGSVLEKRPDLTRDQLIRTKDLMNRAVLDCLVTDYEHLIEAIELPDPDDRHVAAAAIHARADAIVTFNLRDFPASALKRYRLEAIHPDDFIQYQFDLNSAAVLIAARACRQRLAAPPKTPEEYVEIMRSQSLPKSADELMPYISII